MGMFRWADTLPLTYKTWYIFVNELLSASMLLLRKLSPIDLVGITQTYFTSLSCFPFLSLVTTNFILNILAGNSQM